MTVIGISDDTTAHEVNKQVTNSHRDEWQRTTSLGGRPAIEGYVYNDSQFRIGGVRLRVEILDGSNQVVGETFGWVYGNIASRGRWPFSMPPPPADKSFRVAVESFHLVAREALGESP